jgi:hypothetical protein
MTAPNCPTSPQTPFFQFEADFVESLRCIPMVVRYKLDSCGIKLKLDQWHAFTEAERKELVHRPCEGTSARQVYREELQALIRTRCDREASLLPLDDRPPWAIPEIVPDPVQAKAQSFGVQLSPERWGNLNVLQRFALVKLSRSSHENANFLPALQEFGLQ